MSRPSASQPHSTVQLPRAAAYCYCTGLPHSAVHLHSLEHCRASISHWKNARKEGATREWRTVCNGNVAKWKTYIANHHAEPVSREP